MWRGSVVVAWVVAVGGEWAAGGEVRPPCVCGPLLLNTDEGWNVI